VKFWSYVIINYQYIYILCTVFRRSTELYEDVRRIAISEVECLSNARASLAALRPQTRTIVACDNERVAITAPKAVESHETVYANGMLIKIPHRL